MEIFISIAVLLVIGILAMTVLRITKNVLYVALVLVVGWVVWIFASPYFFPEGTTLTEASKTMNETFKEKALEDIDANTRRIGDSISESVVDGVGKQFDAAVEGGGIEAWDVEESPQNIDAQSETFYQKTVRAIRTILSRTFSIN